MPAGVITAIETPRRGSRARVLRIDGEPMLTTARAVVDALAIAVGQEHDLADLASRIAEAEPEAAEKRALRIVSRAETTRAGLTDRLLADGYSEDAARETAREFAERGWVDDARFAGILARSLEARRYGRDRVLRTLLARGVPAEIARGTLDEIAPAGSEPERAAAAARRLAPACRGSVARLAARLVRRGYDSRTAWAAARDAVGGEDPGEDPGDASDLDA